MKPPDIIEVTLRVVEAFGMGSAVVALADARIRYKSTDGYSEENSVQSIVNTFGYSNKFSDKVAIGQG